MSGPMPSMRVIELLSDCTRSSGAPDVAIEAVSSQLPVPLPRDYVDFLRWSDGIEGFLAEPDGPYVALWSTAAIPERNSGYSVRDFAPGLVLVGSDGGGEAFGFFRGQYVIVPFVPLDLSEAIIVSPSFEGFLTGLKSRLDG